MSELTPEPKHRWVPDKFRTGFTCLDHPGESGWDWHVDEVRRLRTQVKTQGEIIAAVREDLKHDCVVSVSCHPYANRPSEFLCGERDHLTLAIMNALVRLDAAEKR